MCSTVHFTYRCGCADKVVFKCLLPHLHHLHPDQGQDQDHPAEQGGDPMEITAPDDNQQQPLAGSPSPTETPLPVPSITITMATSLDEECQDCTASRHGATSTTKLDEEDDIGSSDGNPLDDLQASSPLSVREEGEVLVVTAGAAETMLPPPPLATVPQQRRQAPRRPRFQRRGVKRHGLREIPLNMV
ncbi:hypothetical protein PG997_015398 [Apiospora hydei]|uniref:Uncharacterized protein n=1 Tax=Apiospora hydei TaxID=1337664 RepID=A0ABR1UR71_9PEZI